MITLRKADERGKTDIGWLDSKHTFSFGQYHDPRYRGFESLRVINDDRVAPGGGFSRHPHDNMEIISYVLKGGLAHKDSIGNGSVIKPGDVQRMSAGTGIMHSEYNHSQTEGVHFLQIWIMPNQRGVAPSYEQKYFSQERKRQRFCLVASEDGQDGSVSLHQDAKMSVALLDGGDPIDYRLAEGRKAWVHLALGAATMNGHRLTEGDGAAVEDEKILRFSQGQAAEIMIIDLATWP